MKQNQQTSVVNYHSPGNDKHELLGVTLTLVDVTKKDEGKYTCLVGNALGYAKEDAYVMVQEKRGKKGEILKYIISKAKFSSDFKECLSQVIQLLSQANSKLFPPLKNGPEPAINWKSITGRQITLQIRHLNELYTWARDTVIWDWSADTFFRQMSNGHNIDVQVIKIHR